MMQEGGISALEAWNDYYLIVGGAAAALTGLQFVVMTLIDGRSEIGHDGESVSAFGTPTVVHFCSALLIAGIGTTPWESIGGVRTALVLAGAVGLAYALVTVIRARRQTGYKPVLEDWIWHAILPIAAYAALIAAGTLVRDDPTDALFGVAGAALLLLFIGIHNAWDTVTYITAQHAGGSPAASSVPARPPRPPVQGRRGRRRR